MWCILVSFPYHLNSMSQKHLHAYFGYLIQDPLITWHPLQNNSPHIPFVPIVRIFYCRWYSCNCNMHWRYPNKSFCNLKNGPPYSKNTYEPCLHTKIYLVIWLIIMIVVYFSIRSQERWLDVLEKGMTFTILKNQISVKSPFVSLIYVGVNIL